MFHGKSYKMSIFLYYEKMMSAFLIFIMLYLLLGYSYRKREINEWNGPNTTKFFVAIIMEEEMIFFWFTAKNRRIVAKICLINLLRGTP